MVVRGVQQLVAEFYSSSNSCRPAKSCIRSSGISWLRWGARSISRANAVVARAQRLEEISAIELKYEISRFGGLYCAGILDDRSLELLFSLDVGEEPLFGSEENRIRKGYM